MRSGQFCEQLLQAIGRNRTQSDSVGLCPTGGRLRSGQFLRMITAGCRTQSDSVGLCRSGGLCVLDSFCEGLLRSVGLIGLCRTLSDWLKFVFSTIFAIENEVLRTHPVWPFKILKSERWGGEAAGPAASQIENVVPGPPGPNGKSN